MALMSRGRSPAGDLADVADLEIPALMDDPAFARANEIASRLTYGRQRLEREKLRLIIEHQLRNKTPDPRSTEDTRLRSQLEALRNLPPLVPEPPAAPADGKLSTNVAEAFRILRGGTVVEPPTHAERLAELGRQIDVVNAAAGEQMAVIDALADEITYRYAAQLKPAWVKLQLEWYRSAQDLARKTRMVQELRAKITQAGMKSCTSVLSMPNVRAPLFLGNEADWNSEIAGWRRTLETLGML